MKKISKIYLIFAFLLFFIFACVLYWIYAPGLNGSFLLDDAGNLWRLAELKSGEFSDWLVFLFDGVGSLGRPLSLLTFAVQYDSWPHAASFKTVNYALHIVNFLLVSFLLFNVVRTIKPHWMGKSPEVVFVLSICLAFIWASAPIHTTTVQYVIQRMTMLAAFWMLLGLNIWIVLLAKVETSKAPGSILFYAVVAVLVCTTLGVLSKENAILLPLLCILYFLIYPQCVPVRLEKKVVMLFLLLSPVICLAVVMLMDFDRYFVSGFSFRDFNAYERMLTQLEIVPIYILKFVYPVGQDFVLFNENYKVVRDLFGSWLTIGSVATFVVLHLFAWAIRLRFPLIFYGVFFYSIGHLLESTVLSLELYFEHRNYLPSVGILFLIMAAGIGLPKRLSMPLFAAFFVIYGGVNSLITFQESKVWGDSLQQAIHWYKENPTSNRAHGHLAAQLVSYGYYEKASEFYEETVEQFENDVTKPLLWLELQCATEGGIRDIDVRSILLSYAEKSYYYKEVKNILGAILKRYESDQCNEKVISELEDTVLVLLDNENFSPDRTDLLITLSKLNFYQGDTVAAHEFMKKAYEASARIDVMLSMAQIEVALGRRDAAKRYLSNAETECDVNPSVECLKLRKNFKELAEEFSR